MEIIESSRSRDHSTKCDVIDHVVYYTYITWPVVCDRRQLELDEIVYFPIII